MRRIRPPAVAGQFYPADPITLREHITELLGSHVAPAAAGHCRALVAPHAGYRYSGAVAAAAYAAIAPIGECLDKVVVIGPAHRKMVRGMALSSADAFVSPFGEVPLATGDRDLLLHQTAISIDDAAHEFEHALEVQLPFLQYLCPAFKLVPIVVGDASPIAVSHALRPFWTEPRTLIVVSTDLSHFHDDETAQRIDRATIDHIVHLRYEQIGAGNACGHRALNGFLHLLKEHSTGVTAIAAANSADAGGPADRVVGYASFIVNPGDA